MTVKIGDKVKVIGTQGYWQVAMIDGNLAWISRIGSKGTDCKWEHLSNMELTTHEKIMQSHETYTPPKSPLEHKLPEGWSLVETKAESYKFSHTTNVTLTVFRRIKKWCVRVSKSDGMDRIINCYPEGTDEPMLAQMHAIDLADKIMKELSDSYQPQITATHSNSKIKIEVGHKVREIGHPEIGEVSKVGTYTALVYFKGEPRDVLLDRLENVMTATLLSTVTPGMKSIKIQFPQEIEAKLVEQIERALGIKVKHTTYGK